MAQPFVGEIRIFAGNFAPANWALCNGQVMAISQNDLLFNLIGTTYGGDGQTTFNLPDLRGRVPMHQGQGQGLSPYALGQLGGTEQVTLTSQQIPAHNHAANANPGTGGQTSPAGDLLAGGEAIDRYQSLTPNVAMHDTTVGVAGGSQPHTNLQPFVAVTYIIALYGIYPSPN